MTVDLDEIDQRVLRELQREARLTHQELGDRVGLSPSAAARRVRRLEVEGYITAYSARIDEARLGFGFNVFVSVRLDRQTDDRLVAFETEVRLCREIVECWLMTGSFDYLIRIAVRDLEEFEHFLTRKLTRLPGVASLESSVPIRRVKFQPGH